MRTLFVALVLIVAITYGVKHVQQLLGDQTDCPHCLGTGLVVAGSDSCGSVGQRIAMARDSDNYDYCNTAHPCRFCGGKGEVKKDQARGIPVGLTTIHDKRGDKAAVPF